MLTLTNIPLSIAGLDEDDDCYDEEEEDNYVADNAMLALVCFMKTHCINVFLFSLIIIHNSIVTFYVIVIINAHIALYNNDLFCITFKTDIHIEERVSQLFFLHRS